VRYLAAKKGSSLYNITHAKVMADIDQVIEFLLSSVYPPAMQLTNYRAGESLTGKPLMIAKAEAARTPLCDALIAIEGYSLTHSLTHSDRNQQRL